MAEWDGVGQSGHFSNLQPCSFICVYVCVFVRACTEGASSLAVSALIPERVKWRGFLCRVPQRRTSEFKSTGSRDDADRKYTQTVGMQSVFRGDRPLCGNNKVMGQCHN